MTEDIEIGRGVGQGCCQSPTLFNMYIEEIIAECMDGSRGICIGGGRFADDMVILGESKEEISNMLEDLNNKCEKYGMRINKKKTKCMVIGRNK
ncbi:MAG: reverse transcriptase domain-containing protein, partial [Arsenophonus sp. NC-PY1-MAG3]